MMKITKFIAILFSSFFVLVSSGCERVELQKSFPNDLVKIAPRIDDCSECPNDDDCCCFVELDNGDNAASLRFCGTTDGPDACSGSYICGLYAPGSGGQDVNLNSTFNPRQPFCMEEGRPFWIYNYSTTDVANIKISCQGDLGNPQIIQLQLQPLDRFYYQTNSSCQLTICQ